MRRKHPPAAGDTLTGEHVYLSTRYWRICMLICCAPLMAICLWGFWELLTALNCGLSGTLLLLALLLLMGFVGIGGLLSVYRSRIVLSSSRITIQGIFRSKSYLREEIAGWRIQPSTPPTLVLELRGSKKKVKVGLIFKLDQVFHAWFEELASLDVEDQASSAKQILEDPELGATKAERKATLERGRGWAKPLTWIAITTTLWSIFFPRPYLLLMAVLALLPWVGVAMMRLVPGLFRADQYKNDAHPSVAFALLFPPCALMLRAVLDFNLLFSASAILIPTLLGGLLAWSILAADPFTRKKRISAIALCVASIAYGFGACVEANCLLDRSVGQGFSPVVAAMHITHGKGEPVYRLELTSWGPRHRNSDVGVSAKTYQAIHVGDRVLVVVHNGRLGIQWFYVAASPHNQRP